MGDDFPRASFVDSADRIVVAGNFNDSPTGTNVDAAAFRLTPGGIPDSSFSGDGIATIDVSTGGYDVAWDAAETPDGKIVVAGRSLFTSGTVSTFNATLARYNANGTWDTTFGNKGVVKADSNYFRDVLVQGDGKILALGRAGLSRYTSSGQLDRTFDKDGIIDVMPMRAKVCMALQTVGTEKYIVVGGWGVVDNTYDDFVLARYKLGDGSLDTSFGIGGSVVTDVGFSDKLTDVEVTSERILAVGRGWGGTFGFPIIVHYSSSGTELSRTITRDVTKTTLVTNVEDSADNLTYYGRFVNGRGGVYYTQDNGTRLLRNDGTLEGTFEVIVPGGFDNLANLTIQNDAFYFTDYITVESIGRTRLWSSDGTSAGTFEITPSQTGASFSDLASLTGVNGALYFTANGDTELWISHPIDTPTGPQTETIMIANGFNGLGSLTDVSGTLYFSDGGTQLWKCIGTQTDRVPTQTQFSNLASLANANGTLYFTDGGGTELWMSDGTGTTQVLLETPLSNLASLTYLNTGLLYYAGTVGIEQGLWKSAVLPDGNLSAPTKIGGQYADAVSLVPLECSLYFTTFESDGWAVWTTDGEGMSERAVRVTSSPYLSLQSLAEVSGTFFFMAKYADEMGVEQLGLWKTYRGSGADSAAIQTVGGESKLIIVGGLTGFYEKLQIDLLVACYNLDGTLDRDWGDEGKVIMPVGNFQYLAQDADGRLSVAIQQDGKIVVSGGAAPDASGRVFFVTRLNPDGTLDQYFSDPNAPSFTISDVTALEGNSGTSAFTFTVTRSGDSSGGATVNFATANGSATAPSDYMTASGVLNFAVGVAQQAVTITVYGDTSKESNETFYVNLSKASGATLGDSQGVGTILNDDTRKLMAAFGEIESHGGLSLDQAGPLTSLASAWWSKNVHTYIPGDLRIELDDLPSGQLAEAYEHTVTLDVNANGAGWFVGLGAPTQGRVDLLTVLAHEIGHVLGYEHSDNPSDLMGATLPLGTRRLPGLDQIEMAPGTLEPLSLSVSAAAIRSALPGVDPHLTSLPLSTAGQSDFNPLLEPLAMEITQRSDSGSEAFAVRVLRDVLNEKTDSLDEELLELLAQAGL